MFEAPWPEEHLKKVTEKLASIHYQLKFAEKASGASNAASSLLAYCHGNLSAVLYELDQCEVKIKEEEREAR